MPSRPLTPTTPPESRFTKLVAMLVRVGFPLHDAEDAAQDAALIALRYANSGKSQRVAKPGAWLKTVAVRAASKAAKERLFCDTDAVSRAVFSSTDETADDADRRDQGEVVRRAVESLPHLRGVVVYCGLEGHTYEEAARRFGVSAGEIGRRLRQARRALKVRLSPLAGRAHVGVKSTRKIARVPARSATLSSAG